MRRIFFCYIVFILPALALGQPDQFPEGEKLFKKGKYEEAIEVLSELIVSEELSKEYAAEAHYMRGKASIELINRYSRSAADSAQLMKHRNGYINAYRDFTKAGEYNVEEIDIRLEKELPALSFKMKQMAISLVGQAETAKLSGEAKMRMYEMAYRHIEPVLVMDSRDHNAYDIKGKCLLVMGDSSGALSQFKNGIELFELYDGEPEFAGAYMYYRAARLELKLNRSQGEARRIMNAGLSALSRESERMNAIMHDLGDDRKQRLKRQYSKTGEILRDYNVELMLNEFPAEEVQRIMENRLRADTGNYNARMMLANLYNRQGLYDSSEVQFQRAVKSHPEEHGAWYEWGKMYFEKGDEIRNALKNIGDDGKLENLNKEIARIFEIAIPPLLEAQSVLPCHNQTSIMLGEIAEFLEDKELLEQVRDTRIECEY